MAFFGIEVKPGKPFIHQPHNLRLHLSQATLGIGSAAKKSIVQCNVGNKSPVFVCCLFPEKTECCQLNLEFEEAHEVVFSVIGPRSIHLSGFYMSNSSCKHPNDESESYGEDIGDTETERSENSEESEYAGSFIDDDEPEIFPSSPDSSAQRNEELFDLKESKDGKRTRRRLRKKYQLSETENDDSSQQKVSTSAIAAEEVLDSEFEDTLPISSLCRVKHASNIGTVKVLEKARKDTDDVNDYKTEDNTDLLGGANATISIQPKSESDMRNQEKNQPVLGGDNGIPKKKIQELEKKKRFPEAGLGLIGSELNQKLDNKEEGNLQQNLFPTSTQLNLEDGVKLNRKRKKQVGKKADNVAKGDLGQKNGSDAVMQDVHVEDKETQEQVSEKKQKRKKRRKNKDDGNATKMELPLLPVFENNRSVMAREAENTYEKANQLSNGIIIEEIEMGKLDGKIASLGKKVRFYYTGKLKESGQVFDSNAGKAPLKFRLGGEEVPDVWNSGLDGMRVGSKRRLIVPPSVRNEGASENIPPNSWVVFDVELVKVR